LLQPIPCQTIFHIVGESLEFCHPASDPASGTAADWYKSVAKARFAFTIELRDTGYHGFLLPADQIIPRQDIF
jgi:hypothetical protein